MATRTPALLSLVPLAIVAGTVLGQEAPRRPTALERPAPVLNGLRLKTFDLAVDVDDSFATAVAEQVFFNPGGFLAEADYFFPLAEGSVPTGLQLRMEGRYEGGNLLTRDRARSIYEGITRRSRDPALLECVGKDVYRCRVFPVPANGDAGVKFSWRQPLASDGAMRRLVLPLDASRFNRMPVGRCSIEVRIRSRGPLQALVCPTHEVEIERRGLREAVVRLNARNATLAGDLVLAWADDEAPIGAVVTSYKRPGRSGWFLLSLDAAFAREKQREAPRDVVLAVDTSNSAGREGVDAASAAVADAAADLRPSDRFAVVGFGSEVRLLQDFTAPGPDTARQLRALLSREPVAGRTRLGAALLGAAEVAAEGRPGTGIVVLTDGRPGGTGDDPAQVARAIAASGHRVGTVGVGERLDAVVLDEVGECGHGSSAYATKESGLDDGVRRALRNTRVVPLTDVEVQVEGVNDLYPRALTMLQEGQSLLLAGRYARGGELDVTLRGCVAGEVVERVVRVRLQEDGGDPAVARLWAARAIGQLMDDARRSSDPERYRGRIEQLGRQYGIVTPYSSMLVLEEGDQKRLLGGMRREALLSSDGGQVVAVSPETITRAAPPAAELSERIARLRRCASGAVDPFGDLLGANRMRLRMVDERAFYRDETGTWIESDLIDAPPASPRLVKFLSENWNELVASDPQVARVCALGSRIVFRLADGSTVRVIEDFDADGKR